MKIVIDASVAIKWILNDDPKEQDVDKAEAVLTLLSLGAVQAFQPLHWKAEVLSVVARKAPKKIKAVCELLLKTPVETVDSFETYLKAAELAASLDHHVFDTLYHVVAFQSEAALVTADEVYFAKAYRLGNIMRLANFPTP